MIRRAVKQIIIALIFLLIFSGFGFLIYHSIRPAPSCSDGIQNQDEEEIDCGGSCLPCELVQIRPLEVLWSKAIPTEGSFYDLAAEVTNLNPNYGSGQAYYRFELIDANDNLIVQYFGTTFILPNQTKYIVQTRVESSASVYKVNFVFDEIEWEKPGDYQPPQLVVQQKEYRLLGSKELGFSQVRAVLVNKTNFNFDKVDIDILLFGSSDRLLALNTTEIRTLLAGQERDFVATWFNQFSGQVVVVKVEAETNIFDQDNYLPAGAGEPERFQEY